MKVYRTEIRNKKFKIVPDRAITGEKDRKAIYDDIHGLPNIKFMTILAACGFFRDATPLKAKAVCDERDKWDEKVGMDIVSAKLDYKDHKQLAKQYDRIFRLLTECAWWTYRRLCWHNDKMKAIATDMEKMYGVKLR